jgi:hypothetical protein
MHIPLRFLVGTIFNNEASNARVWMVSALDALEVVVKIKIASESE